MGANPNSGRFAGMQNATGLQQAAMRANAMTGARNQAQQMGYARKLDAAGLGRGLAGASIAAYGGANQAGSMAGGNAQSAGMNYMGYGHGANTIAGGQKMQLSGLSSVLNSRRSRTLTRKTASWAILVRSLAALALWQKVAGLQAVSDRRIKENIEEVGVDQRTALPLYEFNYKEGFGDPNIRYVGVMADEVELSLPRRSALWITGFKAVNYDLLGIEFKEVSNGA